MAHELAFRSGYYEDPAMRRGLNTLASKVFGLDFTPWCDLGHGLSEYLPFSFWAGEEVAANVSASPMNLTVRGHEVKAVQIGTVATLPEYRRRGLVRRLMEQVDAHWRGRRELFFLFANDNVLDFYTRFGFRPVTQREYTSPAPVFTGTQSTSTRLLDLGREDDLGLFVSLAQRRAPVSNTLGVHRQSWLVLFHAACVHANQILYIEPLDVIVLSRIDETELCLYDVIGAHVPSLRELYPFVGAPHVERVWYGFTPDRLEVEVSDTKPVADAQLSVRGAFPIENESFLFPKTSHA